MMRVELNPDGQGRRFAVLRPLRGSEELAFDEGDAFSGSMLIDALLLPAAGASIGPGDADRLTVADRDRLLAALYRACFGDRIESVCRCRACGDQFEIGFSLRAIEAGQATPRDAAVEGPDGEGYFRSDGARFRLPTVADLRAIASLDLDARVPALRVRCVAEAGGDVPAERIDELMETVGPLLSCDLEAACPQCGAEETLSFDLERYLRAALAIERRYLTREIHLIASAYHWPLGDIMALPREDRRALVRCVEANRGGTT